MIMSTYAEKAFNKLQPIHDINKSKQTKNLSEKEQSIYQKPTTDSTLNRKRLNTFPLTSGMKHSPFLFIIVLSNQCNETRKENKRNADWEEIKLPLLTDGTIVYIENSKKSTLKTHRISKFSKVTGYKINTQKIKYICI